MMKYFNNVKSYKELKETYRALLKKNHPDNGGDLETMQEINQEYDIAFRIWKDRAIKNEDITEEEKQETAQSTRRQFYTANGWEGSRYDANLSLKEIAVIVRKYVKEKYPTCKFSVRTSYASMCRELHVEIKEFPDKMYKTADDLRAEGLRDIVDGQKCYNYKDDVSAMMKKLRANGYFDLDSWYDEDVYNAYEKAVADSKFYAIKSDYFLSVIDDVDAFVRSYNYEDCDGMIDYFNVNFYYFGCKFDHCMQVEKVARIKDTDNKPATKEAETKQIDTSGEAFTVEESQHTKTGEKIYLVKWLDTLSRDNYIKLNNQIKKLGGYYSKFTHSFIFKEDPSEALKEVKIA
ncbi:MAG TPA: molecular chaperone DnaJ [Eubacterium sp.]|nr:molecular chaperone DnaJ [Eubacterium sp.]HCW37909.1 molecular chaperone DnaJ [Eubacterium sp.]